MNLLDLLINKTVELAIKEGVLKSKAIIVDATHTKSRYNQKSAGEELLKRAKNLRKTLYGVHPEIKEDLPNKVTTGEKIDGKELIALIEKSREAGIDVNEVIGDTAYSEKKNLEYTKENKILLICHHPIYI
ncbi:hypothetical protein KPL44_11530 [Clostridium sp. DSM 17811]|nr:hypothetical protein [Clostridium sp. DSM 17811]